MHRSRWHLYPAAQQQLLIHEYAAWVLEDYHRARYPDARRYWEKGDLEIDCVRYDPDDLGRVIITEIKNRKLSKAEKVDLEAQLRRTLDTSALAKSFGLAKVEVLGVDDVVSAL